MGLILHSFGTKCTQEAGDNLTNIWERNTAMPALGKRWSRRLYSVLGEHPSFSLTLKKSYFLLHPCSILPVFHVSSCMSSFYGHYLTTNMAIETPNHLSIERRLFMD